VAALRDNDGAEPNELRATLYPWLASGRRELFIGVPNHGQTLEPQLIHHNGEKLLREILGIADTADLATWMKREKTEVALRVASSPQPIIPPQYMLDAAVFIHG
jgi:putative ATP-dependent endonuclease of OLD family